MKKLLIFIILVLAMSASAQTAEKPSRFVGLFVGVNVSNRFTKPVEKPNFDVNAIAIWRLKGRLNFQVLVLFPLNKTVSNNSFAPIYSVGLSYKIL